VKYCEILEVNKMEVLNTVDKINIMYSSLVAPYLKYCACLQPLPITIDFHPATVIHISSKRYSIGEEVYILKVDIVARYRNIYIC
jgi:hypothetical protein